MMRLRTPLCLLACVALGCSAATETASTDLGAGGTQDLTKPSETSAEDVPPAVDATIEPEADIDVPDVPPPTECEKLGQVAFPWSEGPYGTHRHDLAADLEIPLVDGKTFTYSVAFAGCHSVVFINDTLPVSGVDPTPLWTRDVDTLIATSPRNTHYVFVSRQAGEAAKKAASEMFGLVLSVLEGLTPEERLFWRARFHVAAVGAGELDAWVGPLLATGIGQLGLAFDRFQRIRGLGSLADVTRQLSGVPEGEWPWASNLAFAAYDVRRFNAEVEREAKLAAEDALVVPLWKGEVVTEFAEMEVALPDAATMAEFDGFEIDVEQRCPNPDAPEPGNCGAWDYLSYLFVYEGEVRRELGRGITTYHREGRWIMDATPMLGWLKEGGTRKFRWEWAPPWNQQPTSTLLSLRFIRRGGTSRPTDIFPLFTGGGFGAAYNTDRKPVDVSIPEGAKRVELYAVITGHGAGTNQCAEFCEHAHEFTVNGTVFLKEHLAPGDPLGCAESIEAGTVPNQWGTWWFGRGGWCPGQQVDPYRADVTDLVKDGKLTVTYRGLLAGTNPPDGAGDINLTSHIVVWR